MKKIFRIAFLIVYVPINQVIQEEKSLSKTPKEDISNISEELPEENIPNVSLEEEKVSQGEEEKTSENTNPEEKKEEIVSKLSFAIIGDTQYFKPENKGSSFRRAVRAINQKNVSLVAAPGDILSSCDNKSVCLGKLANWKGVFSIAYKVYASMGNHDRTGGEKSDQAWQSFFNFPTNGPAGFSELAYSFDYENSHFVFLNSEKPQENNINSTQRNWLRNDLQQTKKENIFVFFHEPAYPASSKIGESLDVNNKDRNDLWSIFAANKVTAVFSGHEHLASRKKINGVYQFVFGNTESSNHDAPKAGMVEYYYRGPHFGLVEVEGKKITVKVFTVDGALINTFSFSS
jgi:predicted phosphodiesterase